MRLVFVSDSKPWSLFIRWFTWSKYSHVGLLFSDDTIIDATFRYGVSKRSLKQFKDHYKTLTFCDVPNIDEDKVRKFAEEQINKSYDWKALFSFFSRHDWTSSEQWFCSELVAVCLHKGGVTIIRKEASRVTPEDLINSPLINIL